MTVRSCERLSNELTLTCSAKRPSLSLAFDINVSQHGDFRVVPEGKNQHLKCDGKLESASVSGKVRCWSGVIAKIKTVTLLPF